MQPGMEDVEIHEQGFQGVWTCAGTFELVAAGVITASEAFLLSIIASYGRGKGKQGRSCFASNRYLASRLGVHDRSIQKMLEKMKAQKLVLWSEGYDKNKVWRRYLASALHTNERVNKLVESLIRQQG